MAFEVPHSFSPSSLSQFTTCPLAFRFNYVERRYSPPMLAATKGTIVHRALEKLFLRPHTSRTPHIAHEDLDESFVEYRDHPDLKDLELNDIELKDLVSDAHQLIDNYFTIEDPRTINPIGLELKLQAPFNDTLVRGVIDRLEIVEGELIVTDYKTGSVPRANSETSKMSGVHIYASLCEKIFGRTPSKVQLLYLSAPALIVATPTSSSMKGVHMRANAVHKAVVSACEKGDFRPNPSILCGWCGYRDLCPAQGGTLPDD